MHRRHQGQLSMIGYVTLGIDDFDRSRASYDVLFT